MTNPDYRALCAELVDALAEQDRCWMLINDARAALAQPEPVAPTDEEIMELMPQPMRDDLATAARALAKLVNHASTATYRIILNRHAVDHARAVLSRYSHQ
jgi:hypothetical protein